jgi:capsular polysaccharide biosynthesis protein
LAYVEPDTLDRLTPNTTYVAPAAGVTIVPGAVVASPAGGVITPDGCLVSELVRRSRDPIEEHPLWTFAAAVDDLPVLKGTTAVIAAPGAAFNFSHFLVDSLPRLALLLEHGERIDHLLVSGTTYQWQRDGLAWLGVDPDTVVSMEDVPAVRAETLLVPNRTGYCPRTAPWARRVMPHRQGRTGAGRRVFLTRSSAAHRRLVNEPAVVEFLHQRGFEMADPQAMTLREQLALMSETAALVIQQGSTQAHLLLAPPGGCSVEIVNRLSPIAEAWILSHLAGWRHAICGATATVPGPSQSEQDQKNLDVEVDLRDLELALEAVLRV